MDMLVFETSLGHAALARLDGVVQALSFGHASERAAVKAVSRVLQSTADATSSVRFTATHFVHPGEEELVDRLRAFADGEPCDFDDLSIATRHLTPFARKVTAACRRIPWGKTLTYGQLANQAGRPGAARAVGSVMARNRVPLIVPCHRVIPASGGLGGFSAPQGVSMKQRLLELEQQSHELLVK